MENYSLWDFFIKMVPRRRLFEQSSHCFAVDVASSIAHHRYRGAVEHCFISRTFESL